MAAIDGLISGLDTTAVINQLMAVERRSGASITQGRSRSQSMIGVMQSLNATLTALRTAALAFAPASSATPSAWASTASSSTQPGLATVTSTGTALPGSATFTVTSVATAGAAVSSGSVPSTSTAVTAGPVVVGRGLGPLGVSGIGSGSTLAGGPHTLSVTRASSGASLTGGPLAATTTIDPAGADLVVDLGSGPQTFRLAGGSYSPSGLAEEVTRASGGALAASVAADGSLRLTTAREGSAATLRLVDAAPALGLTDTATTATGTDAVVDLDGTSTTLTDVGPGSTVTLTGAGAQAVTLTLSGGLRAGSASLTDLGLAAGSTLAQVVGAVNGSTTASGVRATAVLAAQDVHRLQLTSTTTGAASDVTVSAGAFDPAGLGSVVELNRGTDTVLRVGTGPGAFDVRSATTSVTGLLPGVTIAAAKADPTTSVTVAVTRDDAAIADRMAALVKAANDALSFVSTRSSYNPDTKASGPLLGNSMTQMLVRRITDTVVGTTSAQPASAGIEVGRDGQVSFDRAEFLAAYAKDPAAVNGTLTTMATRIAEVARQASDPVDGFVTAQVTAEQSRLRGYTQQLASFEARMTLREAALRRQYSALENTLGALRSQSQWLTSQLAALPTTKTTTS